MKFCCCCLFLRQINLLSVYLLFSPYKPRDILKGVLPLYFYNLCGAHMRERKTKFQGNCFLGYDRPVAYIWKTKYSSCIDKLHAQVCTAMVKTRS